MGRVKLNVRIRFGGETGEVTEILDEPNSGLAVLQMRGHSFTVPAALIEAALDGSIELIGVARLCLGASPSNVHDIPIERSIEAIEKERFMQRLVEMAIRYGGDLTELHSFLEDVRGGLGTDYPIPSCSELWDKAEREDPSGYQAWSP